MENFDLQSNLQQSAIAYYRHEYNLGSILLKGCLRRMSMLPNNVEQAAYLNQTITTINMMVERCDYTGLADVIMFELIQNFPEFESLLVDESQDNN